MIVNNNSGKSKMMLLIIGVVALLILLGSVGIFVMKGKKAGKHPKVVDKGPAFEMALGEFIVNLADKDQLRYAKVDIVLELHGEAPKAEGEGEAKAPAPIRDAVIEVFGKKTFSELLEPDGKEKVKEDIIKAVNERLAKSETKAEASEAFFNEFAMQ